MQALNVTAEDFRMPLAAPAHTTEHPCPLSPRRLAAGTRSYCCERIVSALPAAAGLARGLGNVRRNVSVDTQPARLPARHGPACRGRRVDPRAHGLRSNGRPGCLARVAGNRTQNSFHYRTIARRGQAGLPAHRAGWPHFRTRTFLARGDHGPAHSLAHEFAILLARASSGTGSASSGSALLD